jgi:probable HAF family extracellular repeat protein
MRWQLPLLAVLGLTVAVGCHEQPLEPSAAGELATEANFQATHYVHEAAGFAGYTATDLGTLGGMRGEAYNMNEAGHVVGLSDTALEHAHAFLWDGKMHDLGTLGGTTSSASDINEAGQVVGWADTPSGYQHAFLWDGTMHDLGTLGGTTSSASDINEAGQVVGGAQTASGSWHAFLWDGTMHDLATLGGTRSVASFINDAGRVAGEIGWGDQEFHPVIWSPVSPIEQLEQCAALVDDLGIQGVLNRGQVHSLITKIDGAASKLNDGKNTPAINKLGAFQNHVNAFVNGEKLTPEQGDELILCVQAVIDRL